MEIAGEDLTIPARLLCLPSRQTIDFMIADGEANPPEEPYQVFDNLYVIGGRSVTAWAITTSEGILLIDSMGNAQEAQDYIVAGLEKMGLNPADINTIIVAHAHGDHYGGANYLRDTYGARIAMSDADWQVLEEVRANPALSPNPRWDAGPERDITLRDGETFTLGDTSIDIVVTPGHTPGTISFIFPVTDDGVEHMAALWGGTAQPPAGPRSDQYEASLERFAELTDAANVDTVLSNHPLVDGTIDKLTRLRANPDGPNPFVVGEATYKRYLSILRECMLAARARPPQPRRAR
jgi:metallo-beta-lactamase class B